MKSERSVYFAKELSNRGNFKIFEQISYDLLPLR